MISIIIGMFVCFLIGLILGGHYGVDSCSDDIENTVILEHIKECIFKEKLSNKNKIDFIKSIISKYYGD